MLSAEGRDAAAQRWYDGESGPTAEVAVKAPAPCSTCGFFVPMAGALRSVFGVCANEWSPSDAGSSASTTGAVPTPRSTSTCRAPSASSPPILDDFELDPV